MKTFKHQSTDIIKRDDIFQYLKELGPRVVGLTIEIGGYVVKITSQETPLSLRGIGPVNGQTYLISLEGV